MPAGMAHPSPSDLLGGREKLEPRCRWDVVRRQLIPSGHIWCHQSLSCVPPHPWQVVANAVAALSEIAESHPSSNLLDLNPQSINKLLTALNECTEWGQIFILDCLANYMPKDDREAQR